MATLIQKKESPIKNVILVGVLVIVLSVIGYLLYSQFLVPAATETTVKALTYPPLSSKIDTSFFSSDTYSKLKVHGNFPISVDRVGNPSPFRVVQ